MKINYGIVALDEKGTILHFCGYENPVKKEDFDKLKSELDNDKEFSLKGTNYTLAEASPEIIEDYRKKYQKTLDEMDTK